MTQRALSTEKDRFSSVNDISTKFPSIEDFSSSLNLETYLEAIGQAESLASCPDEVDYGRLFHEERRRGLEQILSVLSGKEIQGKGHVEEYLRDQYRRNLRVSTFRGTFRAIESFLVFLKERGRCHLEEIMREDFEAYIEHEQDRGLKASTIEMRLRTLKAFIRFLIERDMVNHKVLSKRIYVKVPDALPRSMDPDDEKRLIGVLEDVRDRAMVLVLLRTGMRVGELLNTLVSEINLKERKIEIYEAEKTRVGRVVYLSDDAIVALKAWLRKRKKNYAYLFYGYGGHPLSYPAARMRFVRLLKIAGLEGRGYSLHCLRHTFATDLLNAGMRLECLQQLLGHSSIEMTRRYARLTDKTREEEYFRAMSIIEKEEANVDNRFYHQLQTAPQTPQLLTPHAEELHEHP